MKRVQPHFCQIIVLCMLYCILRYQFSSCITQCVWTLNMHENYCQRHLIDNITTRQTAWSISRTLACNYFCTHELSTASMIATSAAVFVRLVLERVRGSSAYNFIYYSILNSCYFNWVKMLSNWCVIMQKMTLVCSCSLFCHWVKIKKPSCAGSGEFIQALKHFN